MWFSGGLESDGLTVGLTIGLSDLKGIFQIHWFHDSLILRFTFKAIHNFKMFLTWKLVIQFACFFMPVLHTTELYTSNAHIFCVDHKADKALSYSLKYMESKAIICFSESWIWCQFIIEALCYSEMTLLKSHVAACWLVYTKYCAIFKCRLQI